MKQKIIIIGAGISGIYLASLLEKKYEVLILEARDRIGGRVFRMDGHDLGPSWIWSHHKRMLKLISSLGLELFAQYTQGYALYDTKEKVELFNAPPSAPSARIKGSLTSLINALHKSLERTKIHLTQEVKSIEENESCVRVKTSTDLYEADYVISTLPPRLAAALEYEPKLALREREKMLATQTWMGNSAKCVIEFKTAFWREKSLSGFAFSHVGPMSEMHDACTQNRAALFGFLHSHARMENIEKNITQQLIRLFCINEEEILKIYVVDWKKEQFTSTPQDSAPLRSHPVYGIDTGAYSQKVLFSSTEFSFEEGGYLEGAIAHATKIAEQLL